MRNLKWFRGLNSDSMPGFGARLYETLTDLQRQHESLAQQVNGSGTSDPAPPPSVSGVQVSGRGGFLHVAVTDSNEVFRGVRYYAEHADNPNFINPQIVPMHDSRNVNIPVGNQSRYVRVYSAYSTTRPSDPVYHGSAAAPIAVNGGGSDAGPEFLPSQGSGTGAPGQGVSGPGLLPFRSKTGAPPIRGEVEKRGRKSVSKPGRSGGFTPGGGRTFDELGDVTFDDLGDSTLDEL